MNIHEFQAKQLLKKYNVKVSNGVVIEDLKDWDAEITKVNSPLYVVKAQVHAGGRGKAGGVKLAKSKDEAKELAEKMMGMTLVTHQTGPEGIIVKKVYIEEGSDIEKEYYVGFILDRATSSVAVIASTEGGVDIEEVAEHTPEKIHKIVINYTTGLQAFHTRKISKLLGLTGDLTKKFAQFAQGCYAAFIASDADQIEINPMIVSSNGEILALDAKFNLDDNALYRQKEIAAMRDTNEEDPLEARATEAGLNYVKMDGSIGCMVNGAGLAMATMDIIKLYGSAPANFLDVGGGATKEKVCEALKIILSDPNVKGILINIFGGIMRCDIIADGVVAAAREVGLSVPLVVRLAGTNVDQGKEILNNSGLKIVAANDLDDAADKIVKQVNGEK